MTTLSMEIRFISFIGPKKEIAELSFNSGLNLIYGPSNTGKSSILDALDFMLGRERELKEIPEHEGYDQILLGVEFSNAKKFTFIRSINGGDFESFEGLHKERPDNQKPVILRPKNGTKKISTVSDFILEKLDLNEKRLKKNKKNETVRLTLRNFLHLAMVTETDIQKEASPYIREQILFVTQDKSKLKLLLTGVDDSALLVEEVEKIQLSRTAKISILEEFIIEQEDKLLINLTEDETLEELEEQDKKISSTIQQEETLLEASEEQYSLFISDRTQLRNKLEQNNERFAEILEMLSRFKLLKDQYQSDILRLENISEAGSLISALPSDICPLCGSASAEVNNHKECDGNLSEIVSAATSEKQKIEILYEDLLIAMKQLKYETESIENIIPKISDSITSVNNKLSELNPELISQRNKYTKLVSIKTHVEKSIDMFAQLNTFKEKKEQLEKEAPEKVKSDDNESNLPTKALFNLSQSVKGLLQKWNFLNSGDIHFDKNTDDFVINGKHRISNGKGHRAITHAAATLGLMKYTEEKEMPHLGFVIIDSPLLAYEEPENDADDLTGTDINIQFLDSLSTWKSRQIIVFENKKSIPEEYASSDRTTHFTKNETGRYGFFPID